MKERLAKVQHEHSSCAGNIAELKDELKCIKHEHAPCTNLIASLRKQLTTHEDIMVRLHALVHLPLFAITRTAPFAE
jgi:predicted  nucleic acid-binding Zn-ribbon protein